MESIYVILGIMILFAVGYEDRYRLVSLNKQLKVRFGRKYILDSGMSFTIDEIKDLRYSGREDIREVKATVGLKMEFPKTDSSELFHKITLNSMKQKTYRYMNYCFELIDIRPYPGTGKKYKKSEIKVLLKITQREE